MATGGLGMNLKNIGNRKQLEGGCLMIFLQKKKWKAIKRDLHMLGIKQDLYIARNRR
jgi:hypothetical protein